MLISPFLRKDPQFIKAAHLSECAWVDWETITVSLCFRSSLSRRYCDRNDQHEVSFERFSHKICVSLRIDIVTFLISDNDRHESIMWWLVELSKQTRYELHIGEYVSLNSIGVWIVSWLSLFPRSLMQYVFYHPVQRSVLEPFYSESVVWASSQRMSSRKSKKITKLTMSYPRLTKRNVCNQITTLEYARHLTTCRDKSKRSAWNQGITLGSLRHTLFSTCSRRS